MASKFELNDTIPAPPGGRVNVLWQSDVNGNVSAHVAPGSSITIQDEGSALTQRTTLNFTGPGVTVTDDAINSRTVITIPGGSQTPWVTDVDAAGHKLENVADILVVNSFVPAGMELGADATGAWLWASDNVSLKLATSDQSRVEIAGGGNVGIPIPHASYKLNVTGDCNLSAGSVYRIGGVAVGQSPWTSDINGGGFNLSNVDTISTKGGLEVAAGGTGNRYAWVDLHTSDSVDYSFRILREPGVNGTTSIIQAGTGGLVLTTEAAAAVIIQTAGAQRINVSAGGTIQMQLGGTLKTLSVDGSGFVKAT